MTDQLGRLKRISLRAAWKAMESDDCEHLLQARYH